jgi:hypothetical protein
VEYYRTVLLKNTIQVTDSDGDGVNDSIVFLPKNPINLQFTLTEDVQNLGLYTEYEEVEEVIDSSGLWDTSNYGGFDGGYGYTINNELNTLNNSGDAGSVSVTTELSVSGCIDPLASNYNPNATKQLKDSCEYDNVGTKKIITPDPSTLTNKNIRCVEGWIYVSRLGRVYSAIMYLGGLTPYRWYYNDGSSFINLSTSQHISYLRTSTFWINTSYTNRFLESTDGKGVPYRTYFHLDNQGGDTISRVIDPRHLVDPDTELGLKIRNATESLSNNFAKTLGKSVGTVINSCQDTNPPCYGCTNTSYDPFGTAGAITPFANQATDVSVDPWLSDTFVTTTKDVGWYKCACFTNGTNYKAHANGYGSSGSNWGNGITVGGTVVQGGVGHFDSLHSVFGGLRFTPAGDYHNSNWAKDEHAQLLVDIYAYKVSWMFYMA